ncbi:MAG: hypothetical protein ABI629_19975 [bacterium]
MRGRGTLLLVLALLGAAAWLYRDVTAGQPGSSWRTIFAEPAPPLPAADLEHLLVFDPADVTALDLRRGERVLHSERTADGWSGVQRPADVNDFLTGLTELYEIMKLDVGTDQLAAHGLAPAAGTIELTRRDAPPLVLLIGNRNPPATAVYAQVSPGGPVVLTGALLIWNVDKLERALAPTG